MSDIVEEIDKLNAAQPLGEYEWPFDTLRRAKAEIEQQRLKIAGLVAQDEVKSGIIRELDAGHDREAVIEEWRDAREAIFAAEHPTPDQFTHLASAELALMTYARSLSRREDDATGRGA